MRQIIEIKEKEDLVVCDNIFCNYEVECAGDDQLINYINMACPDCGQNLLTIEDYVQYQRVKKVFNFINKWFSWITIFSNKKTEKEKTVVLHVHNGLKFEEKNNE